MKIKSKEQGFTLIELLLVVVIIGILLSVIVPRAWRANVDAKYGLLRQTASELGSFATQWAQQQSEAADPDSGATDNAYFGSLFGRSGAGGLTTADVQFIANPSPNGNDGNWFGAAANVYNRSPNLVEATVNDIIPVGTNLSNPFNNADVFSAANSPGDDQVVPGALALARVNDGNRNYYAFLFLGEDSDDDETFHAGQMDGSDIEMLRNGVFMARTSIQ